MTPAVTADLMFLFGPHMMVAVGDEYKSTVNTAVMEKS